MQCVNASMPVPAVNAGGRPRVSSGSQIASARQQVRAQDDRLATGLGKLDQCPAARLAARPRGGRNRDHRRHRGPDLVLTPSGQVVVGQPAGMGDQQPDRLGGIDRAAAADPDQAVATSRRDSDPARRGRPPRSGWPARR